MRGRVRFSLRSPEKFPGTGSGRASLCQPRHPAPPLLPPGSGLLGVRGGCPCRALGSGAASAELLEVMAKGFLPKLSYCNLLVPFHRREMRSCSAVTVFLESHRICSGCC